MFPIKNNKSAFSLEVILLTVFAIIFLVFLWYEFRPYQVKKYCNGFARDQAIEGQQLGVLDFISLPIETVVDDKVDEYRKEKGIYDHKIYNHLYIECLREYGI